MHQQQPGSGRDDEMSVSLVEETGVPGGNHLHGKCSYYLHGSAGDPSIIGIDHTGAREGRPED